MRSRSVETFHRPLGGIKSGYAGHVPLALTHAEQPQFASHFGAFSGGEYRPEPKHIVREKDYDKSAKAPTCRAAYSMPGYRGHRRGQEEYFGTSFWSANTSSPIPQQRRDVHMRSARVPREWRMTPQPGGANVGPALTPRNTHLAHASAPAAARPPPPSTPSPAAAPPPASSGLPPRPVSQTPPRRPAPESRPAAGTSSDAPPVSARTPRGKGNFKEGLPSGTPRQQQQADWTLTSEDHGRSVPEPGKSRASAKSSQLREIISVAAQRDPSDVALKGREVKRITSGLRGRADVWVPPAGLYLGNMTKGLNQNLWDAAKDTRHKGPAPEVPREAWVEPPNARDPEVVALKPKHVRQITKNLRGPASTWKPPAGLYIENSGTSTGGLGHNMWDVLRSKVETLKASAPPPVVAAGLAVKV